MPNKKLRNLKLTVNLVTFVALGFFIVALREPLSQAVSDLGNVTLWILALMLPVQLVNYHAQTKMYQGIFAIVGNKLRYSFLYKTCLELNFVNLVFPSGGVTGISYFGMRISSGKTITGGKATLVQFMKLAMLFLAFEFLILFGVIGLILGGHMNTLTILTSIGVSLALLTGTSGFIYLVRSKSRIDRFVLGFIRLFNKETHLIRKNTAETINTHWLQKLLHDIHTNFHAVEKRVRQLGWPFFWAFIANLAEVLTIYVVFLAFGIQINLGAIILAYAVANVAGLISILPGGVGIYEGLMLAVLASAGVPAAESLPVIIMYRVVNTIIQIVPGYYFYEKSVLSNKLALDRVGEVLD